jgi:flagellar biosynthesis chaperone FliJ
MSSKNDDISARTAPGRYDLPGGGYEIIETESIGSPAPQSISRRVLMAYRPAYLSEDETVLACCHHAHEVAKAHGAREVMLEHLIHALVRVPESAQVLSDRGINVESLKRESAAVISSEIPVDHTTMIAQLRASKDFNTVMHLAAAAASRRDERSLGARDLLEALLRFDPKSRVVRMIRRHAIEGEIDEPVDPLAEVKVLMERYAGEQRDLRLAVNELRNAQSGQTSNAIAGVDDRLRGLERSLAQLIAGGADRFDANDRFKDFHDTLSAHRNDTRAVADRIQAIERLLNAGSGTGATSALQSMIGDRFLSMQKSLEATAQRLEKLEASLDAKLAAAGGAGTLPAGLDQVPDRLQGLERQISAQRTDLQTWQAAVGEDIKAIEEMFDLIPADGGSRPALADGQVQALQQAIETHRAETQKVAATVQDRHTSFERMLDAKLAAISGPNGVNERLAGVKGSLDTELEQIRKAMQALGNAQATLSGAIDEWRQNNSGDLSIISNRLATLEQAALAMQEPEPVAKPFDRTVAGTGSQTATSPAIQQAVATSAPKAALPQPQATQATGPSSGLLDKVDRVLAGRYHTN